MGPDQEPSLRFLEQADPLRFEAMNSLTLCLLGTAPLLLLAAPARAQAPTLLPGWPVEVDGSSVAGGLLVDLDGDPELELVQVAGSAGLGGAIHALNPDGSSVPGWPVAMDAGSFSAPAFGDVDGDGLGEVVLTTFYFGISGDLVVLNHDGTAVPGFPLSYGGPLKGPALGDLDGDGDLEIVVAFNSGGIGSLYALQGDGSVMPGWPQAYGSVSGSAPSIGDVDGDGTPEIFAPSYEQLYGFRPDGSALPGFPFDPGAQFFNYNTTTLADLDRDGDRELVFATSAQFVDSPGRVWVLDHDGTAASGWPQSTNTAIWASPSVADLDGDGLLDVVVGDQLLSPTPVNSIYAWDNQGTSLPGFPVTGLDAVTSQITIADVDGDLMPELLYETNVAGDDFHALNHDGTPVSGWPLGVDWSSFHQQLSVGDVNGDGLLDIAGSGDNPNTSKTKLYLWTTNAAYDATLAPVATHMYGPTRDGHVGKESAPLLIELGCDVNPAGSLLAQGGLPEIGTTFTLGVDNPLGTQPAGSIAVLALSAVTIPGPCGQLVPGLGMAGPYGTGELLLGAGYLFLGFQPWTGTGNPASFPVAVPLDFGLVGLHAGFQGALVEIGSGVALTRAFDARFGF